LEINNLFLLTSVRRNDLTYIFLNLIFDKKLMTDEIIEHDSLLDGMLREVITLYPEFSNREARIVWEWGIRDYAHISVCGCCGTISIGVNPQLKNNPRITKSVIAHEFSSLSLPQYEPGIPRIIKRIPVFGTVAFPIIKNYIDGIIDGDVRKRLERNGEIRFDYLDHIGPLRRSLRNVFHFFNYYRDAVRYNSDSRWLRKLMGVDVT
jgi:hypothetical protein